MEKDYVVRPYRSGDEEEIVRLLQSVFDGWPHVDLGRSPLDHWRWKYLDNPFKASCVTLGVCDGKIIGALHEFLLRIKIGDGVHLCTYAGDAAVHSGFRRMGVHNKMIEQVRRQRKEAGARLAYLITQNPVLIKSFSKKQYRFPFPILNLVRIHDIHKQLQAMPVEHPWLVESGFRVAKLINDAENAIKGPAPATRDLRIEEIHVFDDGIDLFWGEVADDYKFIVERRREFLNWRYCDPRAGDFVVKKVEDDDGRILGYSVLRINRYRREYPVGYLVELMTLPSRLDAADALVADAVRFFDEQNINVVNFLVVKNHPHEKILHRHGFLDSRIKLQLFISSSTEIVDELNTLEISPTDEMYFSYGDIDSLPVEIPDNR